MSMINKTPFLNDLWMYSIDSRTWYQIKLTDFSQQLDYLSNHCLAVLTDESTYEKVVIFGGLYNFPKEDVSDVKSCLSNTTIVGVLHKNQQGGRENNEMHLRFQLPDTLKNKKSSMMETSGRAAGKTITIPHFS